MEALERSGLASYMTGSEALAACGSLRQIMDIDVVVDASGDQLCVAPGTYTSSENVPADWLQTAITCDDTDSTGDVDAALATFVLAAGETVGHCR